MTKKYLTYLLFSAILLMTSCWCHDCLNCGYDYECYATNTATIFKNGEPIETYYFIDTQYTTFANKCVSVDEACLTKCPISISKDSALKFFHPHKEFMDKSSFYKKYGNLSFSKDCGTIAIQHSKLPAPTLFITLEGYKLLEQCDYDSVTMVFTFDSYMYNSQRELDSWKDYGYKYYRK